MSALSDALAKLTEAVGAKGKAEDAPEPAEHEAITALREALGDQIDEQIETALAAMNEALAEDDDGEPEEVEELDYSDEAAVRAHVQKLEWEKGAAEALVGVSLKEDTTLEQAKRSVARTADGTFVYTGERAPEAPPAPTKEKPARNAAAPGRAGRRSPVTEPAPKRDTLGDNTTGL